MGEPQFRDGARHVPWKDLEPKGAADYKFVVGLMTEEQYDVDNWQLEDTYKTDTGQVVSYWRAPLAGLQRWGAIKEQRHVERRSAWQARVDRDEEYSESMTELIEKGTANG
jgi:hypothetical protein